MKLLSVLSTVMLASLAAGSGVYQGVTVGFSPYSHPVSTQYHAQDVLGQYVYGYATPTSAKNELKTADGVTRGGYSYIDSYGVLQSVQYEADPVHGFRVAATNLPQDLPDVAFEKAKHLAEFEAIKNERAGIAAQRTAEVLNPLPVVLPAPVQDLPEVIKARAEHLAAFEATKIEHAALRAHAVNFSPDLEHLPSVVVAAAPVHYSAPIAYAPAIYSASSSQFHAQNGLGEYTYGYAGPHSSKAEAKTADGVTRGGYSYIDANGVLQTVHYISDPVNGFRVAATNLPVGPESPAAVAPVHY